MSATQDHTSIPFFHTSPQSPIRLLELPPKLLSLLNSDNPPILQIKSAPPSSSADSSPRHASSEAHAVLCTPTETFSLKNVHSSNSIFLLSPSLQDPSNLETSDDIPQYGVSIVSTAASYLELLPIAPDPVPHLRNLVPIYHGFEEDAEQDPEGDLHMPEPEVERSGWEGIRDKVPVSEDEFMRGWIEIAGFELNSIAYRPSPAFALNLLNRVQLASALSSIKLFDPTKPFSTTSLLHALDDDECPTPILEAFLRRICDPSKGQWGHDGKDGEGGWTINKDRLREWTGRLVLEQESDKRKTRMVEQNASLPLSSFIEQWKNALPDDYEHGELTPEMLKAYHYLPTSSTICFLEPGSAPPSSGAGVGAPVSGGNTKPKGKWHEKFAAKKRK